MDTQRLRQKILDLAIRGKLVEQDPADEPASALLERIHTEKLAMVERGELKPKDVKNDSVIYIGDDNLHYEKAGDAEPACIEDEIPFGIPESWRWARVCSLCPEPKYGTSRKSEQSGIMPVLRMGNITRKGTIDYSDLVFTSDESDIEKYSLEPADVIFNRTNSREWVGKTAYYSGDVPAIYAGYLVKIHPIGVLGSYVNHAMCSQYERNWCMSVKTDGVNQSNINVQKLNRFLLPIPPLEEQRRIVAALDKYLGLVDRIEREEAELDELVSKAKAKVLDLAIRGKLVEQDPNDEPASALLERIHVEKLAMVERGELPASAVRADTVIYRGDDNSYYEKDSKGKLASVEVPFELPEAWRWARLRAVCLPMFKKDPQGATFRYIDIDSIDNVLCAVGTPKSIPATEAPSRASRGVCAGTTLFSMVRPYLRNIALVDDELSDCIASTGFYTCHPVSRINPKWLYYVMTSEYVVTCINSHMRGDNSPSVRKDEVDALLVPIPPEEEQRRVVLRVEKLFKLVELT